jgi:carbamoyltransferase
MTISDPPQPSDDPEREGIPDHAADTSTAHDQADFEDRTGLPLLVNTSLNTSGRPIVDTPREALELFGSAPVDLLAIGPFAVRRTDAYR